MARTVELDVRADDPASCLRYAVYASAAARGVSMAELARRLGMPPSSLTYRLQALGSERSDTDVASFLRGCDEVLHPGGGWLVRLWLHEVSRTRRQINAPREWWGAVRPLRTFRAPIDVLIATEALVAYHGLDAAERRPVSSSARIEARHVVAACCHVATGPFVEASRALDLLALLLPDWGDELAAVARTSPVGFNLLRVVDRALRHRPAVRALQRASLEILDAGLRDTPIDLIRSWQLRAIRRLVRDVMGDASLAADEHALRHEVFELAVRQFEESADPASGLPSRARYAVWCLAELVSDPRVGAVYTRLHDRFGTHPELADVFATLGPRSAVIDRLEREGGDSYRWQVDPAALPANIENVLDVVLPSDGVRGPLAALGAQARAATSRLTREMLITPCPIRRRTLLRVLAACGVELRELVATACDAVAREALGRPGTPTFMAENALWAIGMLRVRASLDLLLGVAPRCADVPQLRRTLAYRLGDALSAEDLPEPKVTAAMQLLEEFAGADQPHDVRWSALHSLGVARRPRSVPVLVAATQAPTADRDVAAMATWALALLDDPLLGPAPVAIGGLGVDQRSLVQIEQQEAAFGLL